MDRLRTANAHELSCDEVRDLHAEYLDGLLLAASMTRIQDHLTACTDCARYDRIVRRGLQLVRDAPDLQPSDDFEQRLQHRLFHLHDATPLAAERPLTSIGVAAAVAAVMAVIAWSPLLLASRGDATAAAEKTEGTAAEPALMQLPSPDPLGGAVSTWYAGHVPPLVTYHGTAELTVFPGPYSPLIVNPPAHGSVRTISTDYRGLE